MSEINDKVQIKEQNQIASISDKYFQSGIEGSKNTQKAYTSDLREFEAFCSDNGFPYLPSTPQADASFMSHLADKGRKPATIERKLASISKNHKAQGFDSPASHPQIKIVLDGIRRMKGTEQKQARAFDAKELESKLSRIGNDVKGLRDKAILLVGFAGAFRRSELASLTLSDLDFQEECLVIRLRKSKTNQHGKYQYKAIFYASNPKLCPIRALSRYLKQVGEREDR